MLSKEGRNILPAFAGTETLEKNFNSISDSFWNRKIWFFLNQKIKNDVKRGAADFSRICRDKTLEKIFN